MHGDLAYIEALGSAPAFFDLCRIGVPFPFNRYGAYVGYKTDHDPRQRATSAGPKTSKFMFERLLEQVRAAVADVPGVVSVRVDLVFEPVWDKSRMSEEALVELGLDD